MGPWTEELKQVLLRNCEFEDRGPRLLIAILPHSARKDSDTKKLIIFQKCSVKRC